MRLWCLFVDSGRGADRGMGGCRTRMCQGQRRRHRDPGRAWGHGQHPLQLRLLVPPGSRSQQTEARGGGKRRGAASGSHTLQVGPRTGATYFACARDRFVVLWLCCVVLCCVVLCLLCCACACVSFDWMRAVGWVGVNPQQGMLLLACCGSFTKIRDEEVLLVTHQMSSDDAGEPLELVPAALRKVSSNSGSHDGDCATKELAAVIINARLGGGPQAAELRANSRGLTMLCNLRPVTLSVFFSSPLPIPALCYRTSACSCHTGRMSCRRCVPPSALRQVGVGRAPQRV